MGHSSIQTQQHRYSAHRNLKGVNFICRAPHALHVTVSGDFNEWHPTSHPLVKQKDGSWFLSVEMRHGHHHFVYLVDGAPTLDPTAMGVARNHKGERVSLIAVS